MCSGNTLLHMSEIIRCYKVANICLSKLKYLKLLKNVWEKGIYGLLNMTLKRIMLTTGGTKDYFGKTSKFQFHFRKIKR